MPEQQDWLVQTKLQPPLLHTDTIERRRLLDALRSGVTTRPVTLISAPAGYGKTTLLASLPALLPGYQLAWLAVDEEDNDPARFLGALLAALQRLHPAVGAGARPHLATDPRRVVAVLINDIMQHLPSPLALVLDDLHYVTEPRVHAALDFLIERMPPHMRLVIATRHDPPLALARLMARRQVAEIRRPHLSFTPEEAARLLNDTLGLELDPEALRALTARTEGWAAGLCLLASSLDRITTDAGRTALLGALAQTDRFVFDFLAAEVLNHQEPTVRSFLLQTSVLADLTPELAGAVTGRPDAARLLEELYGKNLFLVVNESGAFRYHALFAEFLRRQLAEEQPDLAPELHRRAALAQPSRMRAVGHFLAAHLYDEAAEVIEQDGAEFTLSGLAVTLCHWGRQIPPAVKERHPRLCLTLSGASVSIGDYPAAYALAAHALEGFARAGQAQGQAVALNVQGSVGMLMGNAAACRTVADRFDQLPALPPAVQARRMSLLAYLNGCAHQWEAAAGAATEALRLAMESGDLAAGAEVLYRFGPWVTALPGCLEAVERFCRWLEGKAGTGNATLRLVVSDRTAWTELQRGRLDAAAAAAERALATKEQIGGYVWLGMSSAATLATLAAIRGDSSAAEAHLETLLRCAEGLAPDQAQVWFYVAGRTHWLLGRPEAVAPLVARLQDPAIRQGFGIGPALAQRLTGLLALSSGRPAEAKAAFAAAVQAEAEYPVTQMVGSARVLLARSLLDLHDAAGAAAEVRRVMDMCEATAMPGLLLQEGQLILPLLHQAGASNRQAAAASLPDPLTDRELDVLRLLAAGATNHEIATALIIGDETVKTHVARILRKLDVPTRSRAGARARELGLIWRA